MICANRRVNMMIISGLEHLLAMSNTRICSQRRRILGIHPSSTTKMVGEYSGSINNQGVQTSWLIKSVFANLVKRVTFVFGKLFGVRFERNRTIKIEYSTLCSINWNRTILSQINSFGACVNLHPNIARPPTPIELEANWFDSRVYTINVRVHRGKQDWNLIDAAPLVKPSTWVHQTCVQWALMIVVLPCRAVTPFTHFPVNKTILLRNTGVRA